MGSFDALLVKYGASMIGYTIVGIILLIIFLISILFML
jgi:hypothetical protein